MKTTLLALTLALCSSTLAIADESVPSVKLQGDGYKVSLSPISVQTDAKINGLLAVSGYNPEFFIAGTLVQCQPYRAFELLCAPTDSQKPYGLHTFALIIHSDGSSGELVSRGGATTEVWSE